MSEGEGVGKRKVRREGKRQTKGRVWRRGSWREGQ